MRMEDLCSTIGPPAIYRATFINNKEQYLESASLFKPEKTDETDLLTDNLVNATICIEKIPEEKPKEPEPLVIKARKMWWQCSLSFDKSKLKNDAAAKLDSIYTVLVENPAATIRDIRLYRWIGSRRIQCKTLR